MTRIISIAAAVGVTQLFAAGACDGDVDMDGFTDSVDVCQDIYDPMQLDTDADGIGDACDDTTPYTDTRVGGCFFSDFPPLRGVNWEDRPTLIEQGDVDPSALFVSIDWTASDSDWIERGPGSTNGVNVWWDIRDEHNPYLYTRTKAEGTGVDTNNDGIIDEIRGTYIMLECETEDATYCDSGDHYVVFTDGEWIAVRVNSLECNRL